MIIKNNNTIILEYNKINSEARVNSETGVNPETGVKSEIKVKSETKIKVRANPIIIDAIQWNKNNLEEVIEFCGADNIQKIYLDKVNQPDNWCLSILGSQQYDVNTSDYIIRNINDELEVINKKLFNQLYTEIESD